MPAFTIDTEKCQRDNICVEECPVMVIASDADSHLPSPTHDFEKLCLHCGHCVSVCPHGAFALDSVSPGNHEVVNKELLPTAAQVIHHMKTRRSIRLFKDAPVPRSQLEKLLDITRYAPTGHNLQPLEWLVINDRQEVSALTKMVITFFRWLINNKPEIAEPTHLKQVVEACDSGRKRVCRNAPHLIIPHAHKKVLAAEVMGAIAMSHLEIAAPAMGLGSCWGGYYGLAATSYPPFLQRLNLPEDHKILGVMMAGFPKYQYHRIPTRNPLKARWL